MIANTIPEAIHICPSCDELTTGLHELCTNCRVVEALYQMHLARQQGAHCTTPAAAKDVLSARHVCGRLLVMTAIVSSFFFLLPYAFRAVFWLERLLGL